jgi:methyl-accepting chemotaxis protein
VAAEVGRVADVVRTNAAAAQQMTGSAEAVGTSIAPIAETMAGQVRSTTSTVSAMDGLRAQIGQLRDQVGALTEHAARLATGGGGAEQIFEKGEIELF